MKAIEVTQHGGPDVLKLIEKPMPEPGPGQVRVKVKAAGINFADLLSREGSYPMAPPLPFTPGMEAAGIVDAVGEGVTTVAIGARVAAILSKASGYAEYVVAPATQIVPLPDGLEDAAATALLIQGLTAYFLLKTAAQIQTGQTVIVSGAAGGVGSLAVQIAKKLGAGKVIGLVSTEEKAAKVRELGADAGVIYTQTGWSDAVKTELDGKGADIYLDASGDISSDTLNALAAGGKWVLYGLQKRDAIVPVSLFGQMIFGGQSLIGFSLYTIGLEQIGAALQDLVQWAVAGEISVIASDSFPLADASLAHQAIAERRTVGKVVLTP